MISSLDGLRKRRRSGLGATTAAQYNEALVAFQTATDPAFQAHERLQAKAEEGALPLETANALEAQFVVLQGRVAAHEEALPNATNDPQAFAAWLLVADALAAETDTFVAAVVAEIGAELVSRPLKIALWATVSVLVLGGAAWGVVKYAERAK